MKFTLLQICFDTFEPQATSFKLQRGQGKHYSKSDCRRDSSLQKNGNRISPHFAFTHFSSLAEPDRAL
ncbi:MAG: hypothetical protein VX258_12010 [Pseudomonadota bacterium]|nr:hypothetical protein [Pseudomonadota bacterium]